MAAASTVLFTLALFREGFIVYLPPIWFSERVELNGYSPQRISHLLTYFLGSLCALVVRLTILNFRSEEHIRISSYHRPH